MGVDPSFWRGRSVLITGHTGFKGSWLFLWLSRMGSRVTGYALDPPSQPSLYEQAGLSRMGTSVIADVRDRSAFKETVEKCRPEVVFHLAAQSIVKLGYTAPVDTFSTNVVGTAVVLDVVRSFPCVKTVIVATSDKCYQNRDWVWGYREIDRLGGRDPYSASKACTEILAAAFSESFYSENGSAVIETVRSGNVIGGGDWSVDRLIPDVFRAMEKNQPVRIRNPRAIRPWQHVLDTLNGYLVLAEKSANGLVDAGGAWNFGPDVSEVASVRDFMDLLEKRLGDGFAWREDDSASYPEARVLVLDSTKARRELGWRQKLGLGEAIDWTAEWYQGAVGAGHEQLASSQIDRFMEIAGHA